jgi:hypothetical protein
VLQVQRETYSTSPGKKRKIQVDPKDTQLSGCRLVTAAGPGARPQVPF